MVSTKEIEYIMNWDVRDKIDNATVYIDKLDYILFDMSEKIEKILKIKNIEELRIEIEDLQVLTDIAKDYKILILEQLEELIK